jgi:tRNA dimethylallyltransferase
MLEEGAVEEVRQLLAHAPAPDVPAMKALGVREITSHLAGARTREEMLAALQQATRNYAKRQFTWFRHQLPRAHLYAAQFSESIWEEIFSFIRKSVDREGSSG